MKYEDIRARMFDEAQQKLPDDLRVCNIEDDEMCLEKNDGFQCTRKKGHDGKYHSSCGALGRLAHKWPVDPIIEMQDEISSEAKQ